jgi:hypothetical protein
MALLKCCVCKQMKEETTFPRNKNRQTGRCVRCKDCNNKRTRIERAKLKFDIISHYSNKECKCSCCGDAHLEFLTIDHIKGGGLAHRTKLGGASYFYLWLKHNHYPEGFRVLCMNCNWVIGKYGYCPHERERTIA